MQTHLAKWREADKAAFAAENQIFDATMKYSRGQGPRPSDEELNHARTLRLAATELFSCVMKKFGPPASNLSNPTSG